MQITNNQYNIAISETSLSATPIYELGRLVKKPQQRTPEEEGLLDNGNNANAAQPVERGPANIAQPSIKAIAGAFAASAVVAPFNAEAAITIGGSTAAVLSGLGAAASTSLAATVLLNTPPAGLTLLIGYGGFKVSKCVGGKALKVVGNAITPNWSNVLREDEAEPLVAEQNEHRAQHGKFFNLRKHAHLLSATERNQISQKNFQVGIDGGDEINPDIF